MEDFKKAKKFCEEYYNKAAAAYDKDVDELINTLKDVYQLKESKVVEHEGTYPTQTNGYKAMRFSPYASKKFVYIMRNGTSYLVVDEVNEAYEEVEKHGGINYYASRTDLSTAKFSELIFNNPKMHGDIYICTLDKEA